VFLRSFLLNPGTLKFVSNNNRENTNSSTDGFGNDHHSVNGKVEKEFLTGAQNLRVKEFEIFEIADQTALPTNRENCQNGC
jgi:hypothetical protein